MYAFKLETLTWIKCEIYGMPKYFLTKLYCRAERSAHTSFVSDTRLYIFGGLNQEGYCSSDILVAEIDPKVSKKLVDGIFNTSQEYKSFIRIK